MCRLRIAAALVSSVLLGPGAVDAQGQRLYKWVDENGNVHYSDRMEASPASSAIKRISANGIPIGTPHSALPKDKGEARQRQEAQRLAQLDAMLLSTYGSELELLRAHDELRAPLEDRLKTAEKTIERLRQDLARQKTRPVNHPSGHDPTGPSIERLQLQIEAEVANLQQLRARRFELYERQNQEVARYRELTSAATAESSPTSSSNPRTVPGGV